ncbi:hypothetical protein ACQKCH_01380 [Nubsella zeaxanthinifaciens]|uniref:hypothetical protein n=1 Tax=Nubsella zeaxanthinifaciens TaxID=392412 RepID=UPI003D049641
MKTLIFLLGLFTFGCTRNSGDSGTTKAIDTIITQKNDSTGNVKQPTIAEQMALGSGNGDDLTPTYEEEKKKLLSQYNKIIEKDTLLTIEDATFRLSTKYYCLKDNELVIPKKFAFGSQQPEDFVTHNFAAKVILSKGQDTLLNTIVKKPMFAELLDDKLNRFGRLGSPRITLDEKNQITVRFGIGIPLTDLATNVYLAINKDGSTSVKAQ